MNYTKTVGYKHGMVMYTPIVETCIITICLILKYTRNYFVHFIASLSLCDYDNFTMNEDAASECSYNVKHLTAKHSIILL